MRILSYIFYAIAVLTAFSASFEILEQMFPDYGFFHIMVGFIGTAMFFPLVPLYPAIYYGEIIYLVVCYLSILLGVILGNKARTNK